MSLWSIAFCCKLTSGLLKLVRYILVTFDLPLNLNATFPSFEKFIGPSHKCVSGLLLLLNQLLILGFPIETKEEKRDPVLRMPPLPTGEDVTLGGPEGEVAGPESVALPESPTRKSRFVRIQRNSNGVETSRTYTDVSTEENERTPLSPLKVVRGRNGGSEKSKMLDDSPIKKTIVRVQRNSNGVEWSRKKVDVTDEPSKTSMAKDAMASPTKTRLVRIRRNSLGMETSRTYVDSDGNSSQGSVGEDGMTRRPRHSSMDMEGSSHHSRESDAAEPYLSMNPDVTNLSPTKNRLVRVRRNSLGVETSRVYVDAIGMSDISTPTGSQHDEDHDPTPFTPMSSPVRQAPKPSISPVKVLSPSKMISQRGKWDAKRESMKKAMDGNKKSTPESRKSQALKKSPLEASPLNLKMPILDETKQSSSKKSLSKVEGGNPHFVTSPNRSKSMINSQLTVDNMKEDKHVQAARLLRVLLGNETASISKESVDQALENHADLLRFQLQQKKKLKQMDEVMEQEKKQNEQMSENYSKEIAKLEKELNKQKTLMQTSLEIKNVEIDILKKERDQKAIKIQQLTWRLAKERMAAKSKEAQGYETTDGFPAPVESTICARCQVLEKDESESSHYLLHLAVSSKKLPEHDDEMSVETPIMGQSASSGMVLSLLDSPNHKKKAASVGSTDKPSFSELEGKLRDTEEKLVAAKKAIALLQRKKEEMKADFEETQHENKSKKAQLKAVLVACNERRKVAEQMLRDLGKFDEVKLAAVSKKPPDELINEINTDFDERPSPSARSTEHETFARQSTTLQEANTKLESELLVLKEKVKEYDEALVLSKEEHEDTRGKLKRKLEDALEKYVKKEKDLIEQIEKSAQALKVSQATVVELETELNQVNERHNLAVEEATESKKELNEARTLVTQSEATITEYSARLLEAHKSIKTLEEKVADVTAKLEGSRRTTEQSEKRANEYLLEITDAKMGLQKTSFRLNESSTKLKETEITLKKAELQVQKYAVELQNVTEALQESEAMAEKYLTMLEEANSTLLKSEKLMKKYDKRNDILDTPSGEEATSDYGESEDCSTATDDLSSKSTKDLLALAARRLENLLPVEEHFAGTESHKESQQILKSPYQSYKKQRMQNDRALQLNHAPRNVERYEVSSVTSTHGADTVTSDRETQLLQQWESSRQHNEDASKIAKLETELAERQLQLNDARRKIDDLTRRNEPSSVSSKGDSSNEALVTALAKVTELKERVAITEAKHKEATKKLLFLKETVLTVVDTGVVL
jgi:hypothetical protein